MKWVLKRVEKFARAALQARGNTEDKYVNWLGPKGSLDRLWISELERRLEANTTRSPADRKALRAKCVREGTSDKRPSFIWERLSTKFTTNAEVPVEPTAILEWTQQYMNAAFRQWIAENALDGIACVLNDENVCRSRAALVRPSAPEACSGSLEYRHRYPTCCRPRASKS